MPNKNMCFFDRGVRALLTVGIFLWVTSSGAVFGSTIITILLGVFGFMNLFAAATGVCLGYSIFRLSTRS